MIIIVHHFLLTFSVVSWRWLSVVGAQEDNANRASADAEAAVCIEDQYWDSRGAKCENCSELLRVFDVSRSPAASQPPDWQVAPAESVKPPLSGLVRLPQSKGNNRQRATSASSGRASNHDAKSASNDSLVLARLISSSAEAAAADREREESDSTNEPELDQAARYSSSSTDYLRDQDLPIGGAKLDAEDATTDDASNIIDEATSPKSGDKPNALAYPQLLLFPEVTSLESLSSSELSNLARLQTRLLNTLFVASREIEQTALETISQCRRNQLDGACQQWANMCALAMYAHADSSSAKSAALASSQLRRQTPIASATRSAKTIGATQKHKQKQRAQLDAGAALSFARPASWQKCAEFSLASVCSSLLDWHRQEKPANYELANIYLDAAENNNNNNDADDDTTNLESAEPATSRQPITLRLNQLIQLIAYKYSFDGQLLGVSQFDLFDMSKFSCATLAANWQLDKTGSSKGQIKVGQNFVNKCELNLLQLEEFLDSRERKNLNETVFYDLFIGFSSPNGGAFIKPVPILIKNLIYNNQLVNLRYWKDASRWKLVRRFFFSSIETLNLGQDGRTTEEQAQLFTFVRNANLDFKFRKQQERGGFLLSSILLHLDYGHYLTTSKSKRSSTNSTSADQEATPIGETQVRINQQLIDMSSGKKDLDLLITILCILSSLWSLIKCYTIQKYQGIFKLDIHSLFVFVVISCDIVGNLVALISLMFTLYLFLLFKLNTLFNTNNNSWQMFAPNADMEHAIFTNLKLAFLFKLVGFAYKLYVTLRVDLFFIDWERPKMLTSMQILQHYQSNSSANLKQQGQKQKTSTGDSHQQQQVSFWRPYTIINRWIQMLTLRRCGLTSQLVMFLCLIEANSTLVHQFTSHSPLKSMPSDFRRETRGQLEIGQSAIFRALVLALVYVGLSVAQYTFKRFFYETVLRNVLGEFVDLCSIANVSLFAMLYPRYGFYVHGRNANGSGDCGLIEMNAMLEREEKELCTKRGLAANSDHQTFVMLLPKIINDHYRKLLMSYSTGSSLLKSSSQQLTSSGNMVRSALNLGQESGGSLAGGSANRIASTNRALVETVVARNRAINHFLTNFLDRIYKDIDYSIREQRRFQAFSLLGDNEENQTTKQESLSLSGGPLVLAANGLTGAQPPPTTTTTSEFTATYYLDRSGSGFTSLLLLGLELDLVICEVFSLLFLDQCFGADSLPLTICLVWFAGKLFNRFFVFCARENLIGKSMLDEKFLTRT